jgi:hypothetical protein
MGPQRKPHLVQLQGIETAIRDPDPTALQLAIDGLDDAFDLQVLTADDRIIDAIDVQRQRHHAFAGQMGVDLDTSVPFD